MKQSLILLSFMWLSASFAQSEAPSSEKSRPEVYIDRGGSHGVAIKIVTGKADVVGALKRSKETAFSAWEVACQAWKSELKKLNKKNLLVANCGRPSLKKEGKGSFTFRSSADYKIKVVAQ